MFPEPNAPSISQPWVRDVTNRAEAVQRASATLQNNSNAQAAHAKASYELIDDRIANINSFTTGLFSQRAYEHSVNSYSTLSALPDLYSYVDGSFTEHSAIIRRIPFAEYNELNVTGYGFFNSYSTTSSTTISSTRGLRPMIQATVPSFTVMTAAGVVVPSALNYGSRWTVENFEPFLDFDIPGNTVPVGWSTLQSNAPPRVFHPLMGTTELQYATDGYTNYTMRYTRQMLMDYMDSITRYATANSPLPTGSRYLPPDVNQVEIIVGYFYRALTTGTSSDLPINDSRLTFEGGVTFNFEGIKNLGY